MAAENERYCFSLGIAVTRWRPRVNILSVSVHKAHPIWTMLANHRKWKQFNIFSWWPQWGSLCGGGSGDWWRLFRSISQVLVYLSASTTDCCPHTPQGKFVHHTVYVCVQRLDNSSVDSASSGIEAAPAPTARWHHYRTTTYTYNRLRVQINDVSSKRSLEKSLKTLLPPINREHGVCLSVLNKQSWRRLRL